MPYAHSWFRAKSLQSVRHGTLTLCAGLSKSRDLPLLGNSPGIQDGDDVLQRMSQRIKGVASIPWSLSSPTFV